MSFECELHYSSRNLWLVTEGIADGCSVLVDQTKGVREFGFHACLWAACRFCFVGLGDTLLLSPLCLCAHNQPSFSAVVLGFRDPPLDSLHVVTIYGDYLARAEGKGFEPSTGCPAPDFESGNDSVWVSLKPVWRGFSPDARPL